MKKRFLTLFLGIVLLASCNTSKEILYFQDIVVNQPEVIEGARDITVQPKDQISIVVSSKIRNWLRCSTSRKFNTVQDIPI